MTHPLIAKKVLLTLSKLKKILSKEKCMSLTDFLHENQIPRDYGKLLTDSGIVIKTKGGTRGLSAYVWGEKPPTIDIAYSVVAAYNKKRGAENKYREKKGGRQTNEKRLISIEKKIDLIIKAIGQ